MIDYKMILLPFLISVILTPLVKQYSIYCGAYAKENKRTVHHGKISRIGGVAIYLAFIITMAIFVKADRQIKGLVIGSSIMFFTGLIDDLIDIKPLVKLTLEVIAAMVLIYFGVSVDIIRLPLGIQTINQVYCICDTGHPNNRKNKRNNTCINLNAQRQTNNIY